MINTIHFYRSLKDSLNAISPGLCLAKWYEVTIHLQNGHTHSCHHPTTHKIPLSELENNPGALHNTIHKKTVRKEVLSGKRPDECRHCWNIEDTVKNDNIFADRIIKSGYPGLPSIDETVSAGPLANPFPKYLEVSFSSTCNFKCTYCSVEVSSAWMKELQKFGPYNTEIPLATIESIKHISKFPITDKEFNPYIDAFWKWWPELYPNLTLMRLTGGEPLLSAHTFKVFQWILSNPKPDLELALNSNMGVPTILINRFINSVKLLIESNSIKEFTLFTSCEAHGSNAEYIRHGMDYQKWLDNCSLFLTEVPDASMSVMVTYNAMSPVSYLSYLIDMSKLKEKFPGRIIVDTALLSNPKCMSIDILSEEFMIYIQQQVAYIKLMCAKGIYHEYELHQMKRVEEYFKSRLVSPLPNVDVLRRDFKVFVDEHDRRCETNFLETFPKMKDFYKLCNES